MRLTLVLVVLVEAAVVRAALQDLPPVDTLVDQLLAGDMTLEQLVDNTPHMPPEYIRDVKHRLTPEMKERIADIVHARAMSKPAPGVEPDVEPEAEPYVESEMEHDADEYEYSYEEYTDPLPDKKEAEETESTADEYAESKEELRGEPAVYKKAEVRPMLRAGKVVVENDGMGDGSSGGSGSTGEGGIGSTGEGGIGSTGEGGIGSTGEGGIGSTGEGGSGRIGESVSGSTGEGGSGSTGEGGVVPAPIPGRVISDRTALRILRNYSIMESNVCKNLYTKLYEYYANDQTTGPSKVDAELQYQKLWRQMADDAARLDLSGLDRSDLVDKFMVLKHKGVAALSDDMLRELNTALTNLETAFSVGAVCDYFATEKCNLKYYADIRVKMASSTNGAELAYYWLTWRGLLARNTRQMYTTYVSRLTTAAKLHNPNADAWSLLTYPYARGNSPDVLAALERVWEREVSPLYWQLHTYARYRLRQRYGAAVPQTGHIPAHLLGSPEADDWSALEPIMRPVKNASALHFHNTCAELGLDVGFLKKTAAELYVKLGLNASSMSDTYSSRLNVAAPGNVNTLFLPRVLDRCYTPNSNSNSKDAAVSIYPTNTTLSDYIELIELFAVMQQYNERVRPQSDGLDFIYKSREDFANYGLDRAVGGARALAAVSPEGLAHLLGFPTLGLTDSERMNIQMVQILKLLPRLAASMAALRWQADVMMGRVTEAQYNAKWWEYKKTYQGVSPPEERDETHFDAFSDGTLTLPNYHLRRLIGGIAMFSAHKFDCRMYAAAGDSLSQCAIFDSVDLGRKIRNILATGNSKPFKDQLAELTGDDQLNGKAMVEQLTPVSEWLVKFNNATDPSRPTGSTQTVAIIVGVVIAVVILGLIVFFVVARRKQRYQDYKGAPSRDTPMAPQQA